MNNSALNSSAMNNSTLNNSQMLPHETSQTLFTKRKNNIRKNSLKKI